MTQLRLIFIIISILLLSSCLRTSETQNENSEKNITLSIDSVPELDSLNSKIIQSINPLFSNIDTLVLADSYPVYCGNTTDREKARDYFPIVTNPSSFSILAKTLGKTILFKSKLYGYDPDY